MMDISGLNPTRRDFLGSILPVGAVGCLGCKNLCGLFGSAYAQETGAHKFTADSQMSFAEVYDFAFKFYYIPTMQGLSGQIGKDDFIEMLKKASDESGRRSAKDFARGVEVADFDAFKAWAIEPERFWKQVLSWEVVENSDDAFEVKVTECLWAKTFREAEAADVGYASICHGDFAYAEGYSPKMRMERTKTLMEGHDCCDHRWLWES